MTENGNRTLVSTNTRATASPLVTKVSPSVWKIRVFDRLNKPSTPFAAALSAGLEFEDIGQAHYPMSTVGQVLGP